MGQTFRAHLFIEAKWENAHILDTEWDSRLHFKNEVKVDEQEWRSASIAHVDSHGKVIPNSYDNSYKVNNEAIVPRHKYSLAAVRFFQKRMIGNKKTNQYVAVSVSRNFCR